jgi:hypothetical protein
MYSRALEQVGVSISSSVVGIFSVFVIVAAASKYDYGLFVAQLAIQYVIARVILAGLLVEMQLRLATAANTDWSVSWELILYVLGFALVMVVAFVMLWQSGFIDVPLLGILIGAGMIASIASVAMKSWLWYRASILIPELVLLSMLLHSRSDLNLESLYQIYQIYYGVQFLLALIGVAKMARKIRITGGNSVRLSDMAAGGVASLSIMGRDRLAVAVAGVLYPAVVVAELAYLMTVFKGALSIIGTLNLVKFIHVAGIKSSINIGKVPLLFENLALGFLAFVGYIALWLYTNYYGNSDYLIAITFRDVVVMISVVLITFNHSIWYSNLVIRRQLWIYNKSAVAFLIAFAILAFCMYVNPILDITLFYGVTQALLVTSGYFFWRMNATKNL